VGIDYLERNKLKAGWTLYVLVIQLFMTIIGLSFLGVYIGSRIDPEGSGMITYGAIGLFVGIFLSFMTLFQFVKSEAKRERRT
jgi:uncharacterized BrkB/YihY/UPF0761 family membrane protein